MKSFLRVSLRLLGVCASGGAVLIFQSDLPLKEVGWWCWGVAVLSWWRTLPPLVEHGDDPHTNDADTDNTGADNASVVPTNVKTTWLSIGSMALLAAAQGSLKGGDEPLFNALYSHHLQMLLWLLGVGCVAWAFSAAQPPQLWAGLRARRDQLYATIRYPQRHVTQSLLLLIVVWAAAVRLYNLEFGIHRMVDEIHSAGAVADLLGRGNMPLLLHYNGTTAFTWFFPYWQAWLVGIFGAGLSPLRFVSVILGVGTVIALFLLLRRLFGGQIALIGAAVLAGLPLHVHFSRIGINNIADPLFGVLALYLLVRGCQVGQRRDWAWAGLCLGLTHYFYEGGRLFYTLFAVCWVGWVWLVRPSGWHRPTWRNISAALVTLLCLTIPLYYAWWVQGLAFAPRLTQVGYSTFDPTLQPLEAFWRQLQPMLALLTHAHPHDSFYRDQPYIPLWLLPFFLAGLAVLVTRLRSGGGSLLVWWCVGSVVGLSLVAPDAPRVLTVAPAWAGIIAVGVGTLGVLFTARQGAVFVAMLLMLWGGVSYHTHTVPSYVQAVFYHEYANGALLQDHDDMLFRLLQLPTATDVIVVSPVLYGSAGYEAFMKFFGRSIPIDYAFSLVQPADFTAEYLASHPQRRNRAIFIPPDHPATAWLPAQYPSAISTSSPYGIPPEKQFRLYFWAYTPSPLSSADSAE
jgi:4-amino-4-deoxy-L-arabinose transferase-like glycosyltransferase